MAAKKNNRFLKHFIWRLEVLAYDIIRLLLTPFPISFISAMGGKVFQFIGPLTNKHHIAKTGLMLAFPKADDAKIKALLSASWNNMGRSFAEFPFIHRFKVFTKNSRIAIIGGERLVAFKEQKQAVVIIAGHFSNWELLAAAFTKTGFPVRVTYRPTNNPYFDKRIQKTRAAYGTKLMVPKSGLKGAKELIDTLRGGTSIALMNDQKFNEGIEVPFFGVGAMTAPGPTRLAIKLGIPLVPMTITRTRGARFVVNVHEPIKLSNSGNRPEDKKADIRATVIKITEFMEEQIRANPTDWFWVHRRWPKDLYRKD